jgi:glyoxylase-like metal-dependent hydrolase (beta-lactamase superfamily II)
MDITVLKLKVTNCYLVRIDRKYLLVDTGYEIEAATHISLTR